MNIGTKSLLFGTHQFLLHPLFVFIAWWRLFGFPKKLPLYIAFVVHDWGYWGQPNMDGPEGESHPWLGAHIMSCLFDRRGGFRHPRHRYHASWFHFVYYHSRFTARRNNINFSDLCLADKLAVASEPPWFYLLRAKATGELWEYIATVKTKHADEPLTDRNPEEWFESVRRFLKQFARHPRRRMNNGLSR